MTNGPRLRLGRSLLPGVLAVALFGVMAAITLNVPFGSAAGFDTDAGITANIGYALFDMVALQDVDSEPFLASLLLVAVVLDAALDAALVLAKREEAGEPVTALSSTTDAAETRAGDEGEPGGAGPAATDGGRDDGIAGVDDREGGSSEPADGGERR